jgi:hypothetical protein
MNARYRFQENPVFPALVLECCDEDISVWVDSDYPRETFLAAKTARKVARTLVQLAERIDRQQRRGLHNERKKKAPSRHRHARAH